MRKLIFLVIIFLLIVLFPSPINSATESLDQSDGCTSLDGGDGIEVAGNFPMYQIFRPSLNRLTKIQVFFGGGGWETGTVTIKSSGGTTLGSVSTAIEEGWYDFVFSPPLTLTPGLSYQIHVSHIPGASLSWVYCQPGNYSSGYGVTGGVPIPDKDYYFRTYGYNQTSPTPPPDNGDNGDEISIEPPSNVEAEDVPDDTGGSVYVHWEKSESAIDGYRLYRRKSEESEEDYVMIEEMDMMPLSYKDEGLENGTEYTYILRSYKGGQESENSNEATVIPENNLAPPTPEGLRIKSRAVDFIEIAWDAVDDEKLDKYVVRYGEGPDDYSEEIEVLKTQREYRAEGLKAGTRYYFRVASKAKSGEVSDFSDFVTEETSPGKGGISWVWITSIIVVVLAGTGIYLYLAHSKKWWPFRQKKIESSVKTDDEKKEQPPKMLGGKTL